MRTRLFLVGGLALTVTAFVATVTHPAAQGRGGAPPVAVGRGGPPTAQQQTTLTPGTGIIAGRVVEAGTASGIGDVLVTIQGDALGLPLAMFANGQRGGPRRILTDADGRFLFRELPAGSYTMTATTTGYHTGIYGDTRLIQVRRSLDLTRALELADGERVMNASIQLWKNGGIGGRVVDEAGEPVVGVPVTVIARHVDWSGPVLRPAATVETDDRGVYHADVTPGDYIVGVLAATTTIPAASIEAFQQATQQGGAALDAYLSDVTANGGPLPRGFGSRVGDFSVTQFNVNVIRVAPTIQPGSTLFYPSVFYPASRTTASATVVSIGSGEERSGIDLVMTRTPALRVAGRVTSPDGVAANLMVSLAAPDPSIARTSPAVFIDSPRAATDANGAFTFVGVTPGPYTLRVIRQARAVGAKTFWAVASINVGESDLTGVEVQLQPGATVSGRVVFEGADKPIPPAQMAAIGVTLRPVPGSVGAMVTWGSNPVEPTGRFTTRELIPGPHAITVAVPGSGWVLKSATVAGRDAVDRPFDLPAGGVSDVIVTLTNRVSTVSGIVRDASSAPSRAATVTIYPVDKSLWRIPGMASRRVQTAAPARDGRYTFRGLPSGDYFIVATDWPAADFSDAAVLAKLITSASRITIGDGGTVAQDLHVVVVR